MRIFFLSLILITAIVLDTSGQIEYGVKSGIGVSKFNKTLFSKNRKTEFALSWNLGVYFDKIIVNKLSIGGSPNFGRFKSKDVNITENLIDDNGMMIGVITTGENETFHYFNFPVSIGYKIKKIQINVGAMASFVVASQSRNFGEFIINGQPGKFENNFENLNSSFVNYGVFSSINYKLFEYLKFGIVYHLGLNDQLKDNRYFNWKARQISFEVIIPL